MKRLLGLAAATIMLSGCGTHFSIKKVVTVKRSCYVYSDRSEICDKVTFLIGQESGNRTWELISITVQDAPSFEPAKRKRLK